MRKLLLQLDSSRLPSVFDRVVAYDGGADEVMSYGGITPGEVRDLVYGCIFTRGPKDLKNTAVFIGGATWRRARRCWPRPRRRGSSRSPCPACWTRTGPTRRRAPPARRCWGGGGGA